MCIGDLVYYYDLSNYHDKLDLKWSGKFRIVDKCGPVNFKIRALSNAREKWVHSNDLRLASPEVIWEHKVENSPVQQTSVPINDSPNAASSMVPTQTMVPSNNSTNFLLQKSVGSSKKFVPIIPSRVQPPRSAKFNTSYGEKHMFSPVVFEQPHVSAAPVSTFVPPIQQIESDEDDDEPMPYEPPNITYKSISPEKAHPSSFNNELVEQANFLPVDSNNTFQTTTPMEVEDNFDANNAQINAQPLNLPSSLNSSSSSFENDNRMDCSFSNVKRTRVTKPKTYYQATPVKNIASKRPPTPVDNEVVPSEATPPIAVKLEDGKVYFKNRTEAVDSNHPLTLRKSQSTP